MTRSTTRVIAWSISIFRLRTQRLKRLSSLTRSAFVNIGFANSRAEKENTKVAMVRFVKLKRSCQCASRSSLIVASLRHTD